MSRLKPKTDDNDLQKIVGRAEVYTTKIGKYKYTVLFPNGAVIHGRKLGIVYTGETVENTLVGHFTGIDTDEIMGRPMKLSDVPLEIIETIKEHLCL